MEACKVAAAIFYPRDKDRSDNTWKLIDIFFFYQRRAEQMC